jgi:hypothetical protein
MDLQANAESQVRFGKDQVHMSDEIRIESGVNGFAENKDQAIRLRLSQVLPAVSQGNQVVLDFSAVKYATQSFVHALIGEALQTYGERALDLIEFRNCSDAVRSVVELVVGYSLGGFAEKISA